MILSNKIILVNAQLFLQNVAHHLSPPFFFLNSFHHASVYTDLSLDCCLLLWWPWLAENFRVQAIHQITKRGLFFFWIHGIYTQEWLLLPLGECSGPTVPITFCSCEQDCVYTEFRGELLTCILLFTPSVRSKCLSSSTKLFLALLLLLSDDVKSKEELEWLRPLWDFDTDSCETTWLCCAALTSGVRVWHVNTAYFMFKQKAAGYIRRI